MENGLAQRVAMSNRSIHSCVVRYAQLGWEEDQIRMRRVETQSAMQRNRPLEVAIQGTVNARATRTDGIRMRSLVETYELDPIEVPDGEPLRFRIELFANQSAVQFSAKVFRWESMRLVPSFDTSSDAPLGSDYCVLVEDDSLGIVECYGKSSNEVLQAVLTRISEALGVDLPSCYE